MSRVRTALLAAVAVLAMVLAGCGTTESADDSSGAGVPTDSAPASGDSGASAADSTAASGDPAGSSAAGGPVTLTDGAGRTVSLDHPATTVVALEWGEAETLISLGVMPVGVADVKGYATWDAAEKLAPSVQDVGTRAEPSVDAIVDLKPDLVVMSGGRSTELADRLAKTVPVLVTTGSDASRQLDRLRDDVDLLAKATGTEAEAEKLLSHMNTVIADGKAAIDKAGASGTPFLMADGWMEGSTVSIRMFAKGSQISDIAEAMGLTNAWTKAGDKQWGLGQSDVEGLAGMTDPDLHFFYSASEEDVFADGLAANPIWKSLPFVKNGQLTKLDKGTWTFGGPASVESVVEQFVAAYAG